MLQQILTKKYRIYLLLIAIGILAADIITKYIVRRDIIEYTAKVFLPFWNWTLIYNQGAAFSFLANQGGWQKMFFNTFAIIISIYLIYFIIFKAYTCISGLAFSFILGGALGNLIDRLIFGRVTDFIDIYYRGYHFPTFNVADSFVTLGVILLIAELVFCNKPREV